MYGRQLPQHTAHETEDLTGLKNRECFVWLNETIHSLAVFRTSRPKNQKINRQYDNDVGVLTRRNAEAGLPS